MADNHNEPLAAPLLPSGGSCIHDIPTFASLDDNDMEGGQMDKSSERDDQDVDPKQVIKSLTTCSTALGLAAGILGNLAGLGGVYLLMLFAAQYDIDLLGKASSMIATWSFWTLFTIATLLAIRWVFLTMVSAILGLASPAANGCGGKDRQGTLGDVRTYKACIDYLDHKFLCSILFGSLTVGMVSNLLVGNFIYDALVGLLGVVVFERWFSCKFEKVLRNDEAIT